VSAAGCIPFIDGAPDTMQLNYRLLKLFDDTGVRRKGSDAALCN